MASHRAPSIIEAPLGPFRLADGERLRHAVERLKEDPALDFRFDAIDGGVTLGATTELQLEIAMWRLWHEFGLRVRVGRPRIAYRSQLVRSVEGEATYVNSVGGAARYVLWLQCGSRLYDTRDGYIHSAVPSVPAARGQGRRSRPRFARRRSAQAKVAASNV